ncbi:putative disease resistance protein At1g50180 [Rosa chinensis]|uniref:putative disease resistance protein At1g50180 n=1 Tax=Rosa chinensis TaxID=74649 RepID=UPI001AD937E1|nr:putative disease resistance protein At1g50180 [Rosa chinensis]
MDEIAREVCSIQREKRCLVVLDDIWTQEANWHSIKAGFPINEETKSWILLTTRKKEVALLASRNDYLLQPQPLNDMQSWELFEKIAICGSDKIDLDVYAKKRELGKKMLVHCSGLPLAISVLAGLLSRREKVEEWETVLRNVDKYIMRGSNVLERESTGQEYGVSSVLALSYDDLPSNLRLCFLYLAQFPEDHEIQGSEEIMEDLSYGCLTELVERSMVQVVSHGLSGKVKTCCLHDLMRDMCLQKAKEENFLGIVNFSLGLVSNATLIGKVRRLALYLDKNVEYEFSRKDGRDGHIRGERRTKIRNVFWNMEQLRHLYLPSIYRVSRKLSFARLCNLQTLVNVSIEKCDLDGLVQLRNLKKLRMRPSESSQLEKLKDMLISSNRTFKHLRSLSLEVIGSGEPSEIVCRGVLIYTSCDCMGK